MALVETAPQSVSPPAPPPKLWDRALAVRARYARWEMAAFFTLGFAFDILTLDRIDSNVTLIQQGVYLLVLAVLLWMEQRYTGETSPPRWLGKVWRFREDALHFLFGSLLSSYTLFYFKSSSGLASLGFLALLLLLLLANETPRFRELGPSLRVGLFSLCVTSYFAYLLPVLIGFLSAWLFVAAVLIGTGGIWLLFRAVKRFRPEDTVGPWRRVMAPGLGVQGLLLALYFLRVIPPVPLAVEDMGIYHGVEKVGSEYQLLYDRPSWKIWERGDQSFNARPGDKVFCFVRIFAPAHFDDRVQIRWSFKDPKRGWVAQDAIPLHITGGREQGFRGYASKANYQPGDWRVSVETEDGREVGRIHFTLKLDGDLSLREFQVERG